VSKPADLVQGMLDMLILKILALQALNGWAISRLRQISSDVLGISDGSLYPALQRPRTSRMESGQWKASEHNRRAKFYSLTRLGRKQLEKETANWNRVSAAISGIVQLKEA
jgi:PadR family transcriptional regulator PadR